MANLSSNSRIHNRQIFDIANENIALRLFKQKVKAFLLTTYLSVISPFLCNLSAAWVLSHHSVSLTYVCVTHLQIMYVCVYYLI